MSSFAFFVENVLHIRTLCSSYADQKYTNRIYSIQCIYFQQFQINVKRIFNRQQAHLSRLLKGEDGLFVSKAIQKAFIEVNEEGAEAAAANRKLFCSDIKSRFFEYLINSGPPSF